MILSTPPEKSAPIYRPLIPMVICVIAGIKTGAYLPGFLLPVLAGSVLLALGIAISLRRVRSAILMPLLLCVATGYVSIQPWVRPDMPADHVIHYAEQGKWRVFGKITEIPPHNLLRPTFVIDACRLEQEERSIAVTGKIRISSRGLLPSLSVGDTVSMAGHLHGIRSFCNPGGFDYERYMALMGVRARLFANADTIRIDKPATGDFRRRLNAVRGHVAETIDEMLSSHHNDTRAVLKALTVGDRTAIHPALRTAFNRAGVAHVLAISGLHIGMVATAAFALGVWAASWLPFLLHRGWTRKAAALSAIIPVLVYGALSGFSPSTQRAVLMTLLVLVGYWIGRRHNWANTLAAAAMTILVLHPPALFSTSFQLSFAAVFTIMLGLRFRQGARSRRAPVRALWRRALDRMLMLMCISILAVLGTLPLVLLYFDQISWVGPLTNLLVVPVTGAVIIPAGLLGVLLLPVSPFAAGICWQAAAWTLVPVLAFIKAVAAWPPASFSTIVPNTFEIGLYYLFLLLPFSGRLLKPKLRTVALAALLIMAAADIVFWVHARYGGRAMRVTVIDVGQGSAHLLRLPGGATMLIDGGGYHDNGAFDIGRSVVGPLLKRYKIQTIDIMVLSHANSDHLNGLLYLLEHFDIGEIWSNHEPADTYGYRQWLDLIDQQQIRHPRYGDIPRHRMINGVAIDIIAPPVDFLSRGHREPWRDLNNNAMVLRVGLGEVSFLFTGDIEGSAEADITARMDPANLRSTILIVAHHGSRTSSTPAFLDAVRPREAVISAGWRNQFGFPHRVVLERLGAIRAAIRRTDLCGAVEITTKGDGYGIGTCRDSSCCAHDPDRR